MTQVVTKKSLEAWRYLYKDRYDVFPDILWLTRSQHDDVRDQMKLKKSQDILCFQGSHVMILEGN